MRPVWGRLTVSAGWGGVFPHHRWKTPDCAILRNKPLTQQAEKQSQSRLHTRLLPLIRRSPGMVADVVRARRGKG
jgi:hypothetical protein